MSTTTWRVLRTELLRGAAPVAFGALLAIGLFMLVTQPQAWAGRWEPLAEYLRGTLLVLCPIAAGAAAWQGGREDRRRIGDLLVSTARPGSQRTVLIWAAVTGGALAGFLLTWLVAAVMTAPVATYAGRGWWWMLAVGLAGLGASSAFGLAAGRVVRWWVAAPGAGILVFVVLALVLFRNVASRGTVWLLPNLDSSTTGTSYLPAGLQLTQLVWFTALTVTLLMLISARRWWLSVLPAVIAVVAALLITAGPGQDRWRDDPAAQELVCTDAGGTELCLSRVNAFLVDDVSPVIGAALADWNAVNRVVDESSRTGLVAPSAAQAGQPDTAFVRFQDFVSWSGGFSAIGVGSPFHGELIESLVRPRCDDPGLLGSQARGVPHAAGDAATLAQAWAYHKATDYGEALFGDPAEWPELQRLHQLSERQQDAWFTQYVAAARRCDTDVLTALAEELE